MSKSYYNPDVALDIKIYPLESFTAYKYAVICTFYRGQLLLSKHKERITWEMQGGHIEEGESPLECAKRELFEESGIRDAELYAVCDYEGQSIDDGAVGVLFLAIANSLEVMPESEMESVMLFDSLPENITYPLMLNKLYNKAKELYKIILTQS